jgi:murein L,D-transpeptidase YafK
MPKSLKSILCAVLLLVSVTVSAEQKADLVVVRKSEARLYLEKNGKVFASFKVALGAHPQGQKQQQGDERTPEGSYTLDSKNAGSAFYKALHVSYPNAKDIAGAKARGVDPGGAIMVHGQKNGFGWSAFVVQLFNWTDGCIALSNRNMDIVWSAVDVGTPIKILP